MLFLSDNAARVHPLVWQAMAAADAPDVPYDGDALSQRLDEAFAALFGKPCTVLWAATGTAANCLALGPMVQPHGGVICHREAHVETSEGGAPGFYLHGAKLLLADGPGAKLTAATITDLLAGIDGSVHQVPAQTITLTQASEYGLCYRPEELAAIGALAQAHRLGLHMDGARFANAAAFLGLPAAQVAGPVDALSFGAVKNGAMNAEAIVFFDQGLAETVRWRRKRAGQLQSKGRFLAAQLLAMLEGDLWLTNARAANAAAACVAEGAGERLGFAVEANEVFVKLTMAERASLRRQGFAFYDWDRELARFVTCWHTDEAEALALSRALANL